MMLAHQMGLVDMTLHRFRNRVNREEFEGGLAASFFDLAIASRGSHCRYGAEIERRLNLKPARHDLVLCSPRSPLSSLRQ